MDYSTGPDPDLASLPDQVDYRNHPNAGQVPTASGDQPAGYSAPGYDHPVDGPVASPQPDSQIRAYDLGNGQYNTLTPTEPDRLPGFSPDLDRQVAWERHIRALG